MSAPNTLSREELLIRSITTLMSIVKPQTTAPSKPNEQDRHHAFQLFLNRIALLFVREPAGEVYSVIISHASSNRYQRDPSELQSSEHKNTRTILYLCPNATKDDSGDSRDVSYPTLKELKGGLRDDWLETILLKGPLHIDHHAEYLQRFVRRLATAKASGKYKADTIFVSPAFLNLQEYVYFSSCRKIQKRLEKKVRIGTKLLSFSEALDTIDPVIASYAIDRSPRRSSASGDSSEEWMGRVGKKMGVTFTFTETRMGSIPVKHIALDATGIRSLRAFFSFLVTTISDNINTVCNVYQAAGMPRNQVDPNKETVREALEVLGMLMEMLWSLLTQTLSVHRFLAAIPEGKALRKWLKKISQWEMVMREITSSHIMKRLQHYPLLIRLIQPPPLLDPKSMATLDDTFAAVLEDFDKKEIRNAVDYLHQLAATEIPHPSSQLWKLLYAWTSKCKAIKLANNSKYQPEKNSLWEKSFSGTVHCEATIAFIQQEGTETKKTTKKRAEDVEFEEVLSKKDKKEDKKEGKENKERVQAFKALAENVANGRPQIGIGKKSCFMCVSYIDLFSKDTGLLHRSSLANNLFLGGKHGKCYPWSIPRSCRPEVRHELLQLLKKEMACILRECLRRQSAGSDSGAESDTNADKYMPNDTRLQRLKRNPFALREGKGSGRGEA